MSAVIGMIKYDGCYIKLLKLKLYVRMLSIVMRKSEDIEYTGIINEAAKEDIKLDTICGTMTEINPTAKGVYFRTSDSCQLKELTRAGRTTQAEQLLIGTLYSQYADRRTLLAGTAHILDQT